MPGSLRCMSSWTKPGEAKVARWRRGYFLLAWVVGGWLSALLIAPHARWWIEEHNHRTTGPSYGLANDAATALAAALDKPTRLAELVGGPEPKPEASCELTWTDREKTYVYAQRASRATPETAWRSVTMAGRAVLGRYVADLWAGDCKAEGTYHEKDCTVVERVRMVERQESAVAAPTAATAPVPLLAGQCVLGAFAAKPGVVGRYKVTLPAEREITVRAFVIPATAFLSYRLSLAGQEAPHVEKESTVFRSLGQGEYDLEVTLLPAVGAADLPGQYSLQVHWGRGVGPRCPIPGFDEGNCYSAGVRSKGQP